MSRGHWYYGYVPERQKSHPCRRCEAAGMRKGLERCHFRAARWGNCDICGWPIFKDECRGSNGTLTCHVRCMNGPEPRPDYMDRLECLPVELEMAA